MRLVTFRGRFGNSNVCVTGIFRRLGDDIASFIASFVQRKGTEYRFSCFLVAALRKTIALMRIGGIAILVPWGLGFSVFEVLSMLFGVGFVITRHNRHFATNSFRAFANFLFIRNRARATSTTTWDHFSRSQMIMNFHGHGSFVSIHCEAIESES